MQKISLILIICVICTLFSGCYDNEEIDTLATVMAVGIEKQDKQKLYTLGLSLFRLRPWGRGPQGPLGDGENLTSIQFSTSTGFY